MSLLLIFIVYLACIVLLGFSGGVGREPILCCVAFTAAHALLYALVFRKLERHRVLGTSMAIIGVGIALRLCFLSYPVTDDMYRYVWEGRLQLHGDNPYVTAPAASKYAAADPLFDGISHKDIATVYGPVVMLVFRGLAALCDGPLSAVSPLVVFKLFFMLCEIGVLLLLPVLLRQWNRPAHWAALYAWNPLILLYGAGEAHLDTLLVLLIAVALFAHGTRSRWRWLLFPAVGAAVMVKYIAIVMLPMMINRRNAAMLVLVPLPALAFLPFCHPDMFDSLRAFGASMHYNDVFPAVFRVLPQWAYVPLMLACLLSGLWWTWLLRQTVPIGAMALAWMWLLLCLPTMHPWYLMPLILFLTHSPSRPWFLLSALLGLQFFVLDYQLDIGVWRPFDWIWIAQFLPMFVLYLYDRNRADQPWLEPMPPLRSIDIVVPTLDEEAGIDQLLTDLREAKETLVAQSRIAADRIRVYLVDGGSSDRTLEIARQQDVEILTVEKPGRGHQFAAGVDAGDGDLVVMLHADARISVDTLIKLQAAAEKHRGLQWGILGHRYTHSTLKMKMIEFSNRFRFHVGGIAFGDQGIFVRRLCLDRVGGVPQIRLMEDVELSLRLLQCPGRRDLGNSLTVSTRRWERKKFTGYTLQVLRLVTEYLVRRRAGADIAMLTDRMYATYYGKAKDSA